MQYVQESMHSNMHNKNDESNKKRSVFLNKIGAIVCAACGSAAIAATRNIGWKEFNGGGGGNDERPRPVPASSKTRGHADALKCTEASSRQSTLSGILTRKWKTGLKRVKVRLKMDGKTKTKTATEAKKEMELCKKRILMGEKCRALNLSGVLHYDKHGILLPED